MKQAPVTRRITGLLGGTTAAVGSIMLAAWKGNDWQYLTFGEEYIPMAPLTAVLFVVLGLALAGKAAWPERAWTRSAALASALGALGVSFLVLLQDRFGLVMPWDGWLVQGQGYRGEIPLGRMSSLTAAVFFLTAAGWLVQNAWRRESRVAHGIVALTVGTAGMISLVVVLGYAGGAPLLYLGDTVPMALLTGVVFLLLDAGILVEGPVRVWTRKREGADEGRLMSAGERALPWRLAVGASLAGGLIALLGFFHLRSQQAEARLGAGDQLDAVANLKAAQLTAWRRERMGEAWFLFKNHTVRQEVVTLANRPDDLEAQARLHDWLEPIKGGERYETVRVFDAQARLLMTVPAVKEVYRQDINPVDFAAALASPEPIFTPLYYDADRGEVHLALLVPVRIPAVSGATLGLIELRVNAQRELYPLIQSWPVVSRTAELILLRREGDEVVYLNELRHRPGAPMSMRAPLGERSLPAAMAMRGASGVQRGRDYRGVPVLFTARSITGTDWVLMAKIDQAEVYALIRREARQTGALVAFLLLLLALGGASIWRRHQAAYLRRALAAEQERNALAERLALVTRHANDVIFLFDDTMRIVEANEQALVVYGWTLAEMKQLNARDLRAPDAEPEPDLPTTAGISGVLFESCHRTRNNGDIPVEVSARVVMIEGRTHVLSVVRDITERKRQEREIRQLNRMYFVTSRINETLVQAHTQMELFEGICQVVVEAGGYRLAWLGWLDPETRLLPAVAMAGVGRDFVAGLRLSTDPSVPEGRGPAGTACREGRTYVCNDFANDPSTELWREPVAALGINACLVLPLRLTGIPRGILIIYAAEKDSFGRREVELMEKSAENISFALEVYAADDKRRKAEAALRENHAFNISVLDSLVDHLVVLDEKGLILSVNEAWDRFARENGAPELAGVRWVGLNYLAACVDAPGYPGSVEAAAAKKGIREVLTGEKEFYQLEYICDSPTEQRWFELRVSPLRGARRGAVVAHKNITDRKRAEIALRQEQELFQGLSSATPDHIYFKDLASRFIRINDSMASYFGLRSPTEAIGRTDLDFFTDEHAQQAMADEKRVLNEGWRIIDLEEKETWPGGRMTWVASTKVPLRDYEGKITGLVGISRDITGRKLAEAEMQKLSRIIEQAPLSVAITDLTGAIEYVNPKFTEVAGYSLQELRGQNSRLLKSGDTPPEVYREMWRTIANGCVWRGELSNRKKTGEVFIELAVIAPVVGQDGKPSHYVALKQDITARKLEEAQLHQSLMELRTLHSVSVAIQRQDLNGHALLTAIAAYLPAAMRWPEKARVVIDIDGRHYQAGVPEGPGPTLTAPVRINGRLAGAVTVGYVEPPETGPDVFLDHEREMIESVALTIGLGLGGREAFAKVQRFNTELEAEVALRTTELAASNREVQALLQAIPDMVMRLRTDGTLLHCQLAHGATGLAVITDGRPVEQASEPLTGLMAFSLPLGQRALAENHTVTGETELDTPGGRLALECRAAPLGADQFVVFVRDITARKRLETETAAMLEKERQVSEMRTRFISVTSHEFRTPMAAAMGSAELLANHLERLAPPKRQELLTRIMASLRRMTEMLDDILTLNRLDANRTEVHCVGVNLRSFVHEAIEEIRIGDQGAHLFEFHAIPHEKLFMTDPNLLHPILTNLLSNAVRYSPAGSLVTVRLTQDAWRMELQVEDRGIGIPLADRDRIFEIFERGSNVHTIKGTGLGLNIVRRMTELLGGTVGVTVLEQGSRFTVALPHHASPPPTT